MCSGVRLEMKSRKVASAGAPLFEHAESHERIVPCRGLHSAPCNGGLPVIAEAGALPRWEGHNSGRIRQ